MLNSDRFVLDLDRVVAAAFRSSGVLVKEITADDSETLCRIRNILTTYYERAGQHYLLNTDPLLSGESKSLDPNGDMKLLIAIRESGVPCGVICLDGAAREVNALATRFEVPPASLKNLVEFRRFVSLADWPLPSVATALMAYATRWAHVNNFDGIVALTRSIQRRFFMRFGLTDLVAQPRKLEDRNGGEYWLLKGDWPSISSAAKRFVDRKDVVAEFS